MPRPVAWTLSLPPHPTGVVYCLHGKGDDHRYAFDTIHFHDFVAAGGAELAVAAVDGGPDSYWHQRSDGSNAQAMFLEDFVPMIDGRLRLSNRAVLGWSMGGYGALLVAETVPRLFRAVAVASPALWTSPGASAPGAFDNADDFRAHDVFVGTARLSAMTVRVDCGRSDPFYRAARTFAARLTPPPQTSYGPGFHDAAFWTSVAPLQVATLRAALGSAA
jgi:pimeloyl-ACP methyl ester carboxylesterase